MAIKRIPVKDLNIGTYVSRLDRPWRETPFLFQGFYVEDEEELQSLRRLCRHVYVVVQEHPSVDEKRPPVKGIVIQELELDDVLEAEAREAQADVSFDKELNSAKKYHTDLNQFVEELWHEIRQGHGLNANVVKESVSVMVKSISRNPDAFVWLSRVKDYDSYSYAHAVNVAAWVTRFGRQLGLSQEQLEELAGGALCLDIGNTRLPREMLAKSGRLSDKEWQLIKTHVDHSVALLRQSEGFGEEVIAMVASHHERYDGSGYPKGLEGDEIPVFGQIAGIVDFYVSVTFPRKARRAVSSDFAINVLFKQRNQYFKASLVEQFIQVIGLFPTGSLVELSTGEVAVVLAQNPDRRLRPRLLLILGADKQPYESYPIMDLLKDTHDKDGQPLNIVRGRRDGDYQIDLSRLML